MRAFGGRLGLGNLSPHPPTTPQNDNPEGFGRDPFACWPGCELGRICPPSLLPPRPCFRIRSKNEETIRGRGVGGAEYIGVLSGLACTHTSGANLSACGACVKAASLKGPTNKGLGKHNLLLTCNWASYSGLAKRRRNLSLGSPGTCPAGGL